MVAAAPGVPVAILRVMLIDGPDPTLGGRVFFPNET